MRRTFSTAMIKAHEIQGCIALENSFNKVGLDHVVLVKVASAAVVAADAGPGPRGDHQRRVAGVGRWPVAAHLSPRPEHRFAQELGGWRRHRRAPCARADFAQDGRDGLSHGAEAKGWGFYDVLFKGNEFKFQRPYGSYVMENVLFKISFPGRVPLADRRRVRDADPRAAREGRQDGRGHQEDHDPHARGLHPHHRQEGSAEQSGRPRPLHPVHGRRADPVRVA
jgi:hypothetical protein